MVLTNEMLSSNYNGGVQEKMECAICMGDMTEGQYIIKTLCGQSPH